MKNLLATAAITTALVLGATATNAFEIGGVRFGNPFDSSTWWDGSTHEMNETITINFADPEFWMSIPNPESHSNMHGAFTNPATWGQMLEVETYTNMMDRDVWAKWLDTSNYDVLRDPQTYAYFMQPGAFQHLLNVEHYTQLATPSAHLDNVDLALGHFGLELTDFTDVLQLSGILGLNDEIAIEAPAETTIEN